MQQMGSELLTKEAKILELEKLLVLEKQETAAKLEELEEEAGGVAEELEAKVEQVQEVVKEKEKVIEVVKEKIVYMEVEKKKAEEGKEDGEEVAAQPTKVSDSSPLATNSSVDTRRYCWSPAARSRCADDA